VGGIYLNECFVFSLSIWFFFISLTICWSSWKYPHPINIIDDGVWDLFRFLLGFRAVFFLLSPVHRLDKELGRLPFFSFFFSRLCVGCYTHTQPAVYSSLKYSTPPLACCRLVRLLLSGGGEKKEKKREKPFCHHIILPTKEISHRAHSLWIYSRPDRSPRLITSNYSEEMSRRRRNKLFSIFMLGLRGGGGGYFIYISNTNVFMERYSIERIITVTWLVEYR
jgi:hypothetical protein